MGLAYKGVCYSSHDYALEAFRADYPKQEAAVVYWLSASTKTGTNQITFSTKTHANAASINNGVITLPSCDLGTSGLEAASLPILIFIAVLFFAFAHGFSSGSKYPS